MKLCIDCKYHSCFTPKCQHENNKSETDPVTGRYNHCCVCAYYRTRVADDVCGMEAKFYEPSLWYRFRKWLGVVK
jgi:hypothetical protein